MKTIEEILPYEFTEAISLWHNWLLQKIPWTKNFIVHEEFIWYINYLNKTGKIIVPYGFLTDFGSIPRWLWIFFDRTKYIAFILHDFLYSKECKLDLTRKEKDLILLEALHIEWASFIEKGLIYLWARFWGWFFIEN